MKLYTVHLKPNAPPRLVREGFSWGALIFGPLWLACKQAWLAALLLMVGWVALYMVCIAMLGPLQGLALFGALFFLQGFCGRDWLRWNLEESGWVLLSVVGGRNETEAWSRLLASRPELINRCVY